MELKALRERVEQATGPDRELDARIWAEFDDRDIVGPKQSAIWSDAFFARSRKPPNDECFLWQPGYVCRVIPHYTSSIDAALALVEKMKPGFRLSMQDYGSGECEASFSDDKWVHEFSGLGKTLPLAILTALLLALEEQP